MAWNNGFGSGGWQPGGGYSIGGVNAVNPQAKGDYQQYQDAAFANAQRRMDPIFEQQRDAFAQRMQNQGLPSGGQGWDKAYRSMADAQNSAYSDAAFGAMQFGQQAQNQDFQQDQARSALANSLLQSRWNTDLGYHNINKTYDLGMNRLNEDARQFDDTTDFNYWDKDNFYKMGYDKMDRDDVRWMSGMERDSWNDQIRNNMGSDLIKQFLMNPEAFSGVNINPLVANQAYGGNLWGQQMNAHNAGWQDIMSLLDSIGGMFGGS